ncbi:MAG: serine acetyltransferase [Pedobacter sp.]|nr:MAG: serine acetyltransferase [Pedobacter sp.]
MITSLNLKDLAGYVSRQVNNIFPDNDTVNFLEETHLINDALQRLEYCFKRVSLKHYFNGSEVIFNHLFSDHYVMFLWFLSNSVYKEKGKCSLANKIYYLNKTLHGLDCMYDTEMPSIFLLFHSSGTMLGKASYGEYFIALHGCTVGSHKGQYPVLGKGVSLTANSSVIGNCVIGNRCTISTRTTLFSKNLPADTTAFINFDSGKLELRQTQQCYAQQFFNVDLKNI